MITEALPQFHSYHLDDDPDLMSCSVVAARSGNEGVKGISEPLPKEDLANFYGACSPLRVRYVLDDREDGVSSDYTFQMLEGIDD